MPNPCTNCVLGCCHRHTVNVSGYDAWVLAAGLQLAPDQFLRAIPLAGPAKHGFLLDRSGASYELALAKRAGAAEPQPCTFLIELPNGTGRCGVYGLRPLVCQTYPAYLRNGMVGRRDDVLCADEAWRDGEIAQPIWYERLTRHFVEDDIYGLAVARWNFHVLHAPLAEIFAPTRYYDYLIEFYTQLEPVRAGVQVADWQAMCRRWDAYIDGGVSPLLTQCDEMAPWAETIAAIRSVGNSFFQSDLAWHMQAEIERWESDRAASGTVVAQGPLAALPEIE